MSSHPRPDNDGVRLIALDGLTPSVETDFDALVRAAARVCQTPIALLASLDGPQQQARHQLGTALLAALEARNAPASRMPSKTEASFEVMCEALPVGVFAADAQGESVYTNPRWQKIYGTTAAGSLGLQWLQAVHPADRDALVEQRQRETRAQTEFVMAYRVVRQDGSIAHLETHRRALVDDRGVVTGFVGAVEDVTDRVLVEQALRDEQQRLASILEGTGAGTWEWNVATGHTYSNEKWAELIGYRFSEFGVLHTQKWRDHIHPEDQLRSTALLEAHFQGRTPAYECELRMRHRDGHWVWLLSRGRVLTWTDDGKPEWMFGIHLDLSARRQQEEALRKSEAFLSRVGEVAGVGGWELDLISRKLFCSPQVCLLAGIAPDDPFSDEQVLKLFSPSARRRVRAAHTRAAADGRGWDLELPLVRPDGRHLWVRLAGHAGFEGQRAVRMTGAFQDITAQVAQRQWGERTRQRLALAADSGAIGIWELDTVRYEFTLDEWGCRAYGLAGTERVMHMQDWLERIHPDDRTATLEAVQPALDGRRQVDTEFRVIWPDGSVRRLRATARRPPAGDSQPQRLVGATWDVTQIRELSAMLAEKHELLRVTLESIGDAVLTTDAQGAVTWLNPVAERLTGWRTEEAEGRRLAEVFQIFHEATREPAENPVTACLRERRNIELAAQTVLVSRQGEEFGIADSASPIRNAAGAVLGAVLVFHDVTSQRRLAGEMNYRATHDGLTGLVNRTEFEHRLDVALNGAHQGGNPTALLYIDLDHFKPVNDACGHAVGDQLLQQVSRILTEAVRSTDTVARLGGDEFAVILDPCAIDQAQRTAQSLCDRMDGFRFLHDGRRFRIGTSVGVVAIDARWSSSVAVLQAADASCYAAKEGGRNRIHTWLDTDLALQTRNSETQWAVRVEHALEEDRFVLFGQRIAALSEAARQSQKGLHAEVLLRLVDVDGTLVAPGAFMPAAERFHLAPHIDRWVLRHASDWLVMQQDILPVETLCINLSGKSIGDRTFHRHALEILASAGPTACSRICLEITETAAVTNMADAALFVDQVRRLGVRIALDDFGAGASSFGYLKTLKVDVLKIDGQFIRDLLDDPLDDAAVRCFVDVARVTGLVTVAEFVDRPEIAERLREIGVDHAQGYLLHRPEPLENLQVPWTSS